MFGGGRAGAASARGAGLRRSAAAAAIVLALAGDAVPGEPGFDADLAACRLLVREEKWQSAQKAYAQLLERFRDDPRVVASLPAIEDDLKICLFRAGRQPPKGPELFGEEVVRFAHSTREIEFVFPRFPGGTRWREVPVSQHVLLDVRFERDVTIEVPAEGPKRGQDALDVSALVCFNPETRGGYGVVNGYDTFFEPDGSQAKGHHGERDHAVFKLGAGEPEQIGRGLAGWPDDERPIGRFVRVVRNDTWIKVEVDGKLGARAQDSTFVGGFVALAVERPRSHSDYDGSVRVKGRIDPLWYRQELAGFEDRAFREWAAKGYDRSKALPAWLLAGRGRPVSEPDLPSDAPEAVRARLRTLLAKALSDAPEEETAAAIAGLGALPERTGLFAAGVAALAAGAAAEAEKALLRLVEAEPGFVWGRVALARALLDRRDLDGARRVLEAARALDPKVPAVHETLALVEICDGDLDAARAAVGAAVAAGAYDGAVERVDRLVGRAIEGPKWPKTYRHSSPHFDVRTDHSLQMANDVAMRLEGCLADFQRLFRAVEGRKGRARVAMFSSRESYLAYGAEVGMDLSQTLGAYAPPLRELVVWYPADRVEFWQTMRHEAFHQFVHNFAEDLPLWFNEGHAEYFAKGPLDEPATKQGGDRADVEALLRAKRGELTPLDRLLRMPRREFMANASLHYAQSWAVVSWLRSRDGPGRRVLERYFDALVAGASPQQAYDAVFAKDAAALGSSFEKYVHSAL